MSSRYPSPLSTYDSHGWATPTAPGHRQHDTPPASLDAPPADPWTHAGANMAAVDFPLGGFGAGNVIIGGDGTLQQWLVVNQVREETEAKADMPGTFFAVSANDGSGAHSFVLSAPTTYAATKPQKTSTSKVPHRCEKWQVERLETLPGIKDISLKGQYPIAELNYDIVGFPVEVTMEAMTPCIPTATKESSLPAAVFTFTVKNPNAKAATVSLMQVQQNFVGWDGHAPCVPGSAVPGWGGNVNTPTAGGLCFSNTTLAPAAEHTGTIDVSVSVSTAAAGDGVAVIPSATSEADVFAQFTGGKAVAPTNAKASAPSAPNEAQMGGVVGTVTVAPGATATVTFVLAWHFPNRSTATSCGKSYVGILPAVIGNRYASWFIDASHVAAYLRANVGAGAWLLENTRNYRDTLFASTVPTVLLGSATSKVAHMRCPTMWWTQAGIVLGTEGNGCCPLNCTHVYGYATLMERLWPSIVQDMRVSDFVRNYDAGAGGCTMRFGRGGWALDGALQCIIKTYLVVQQNDPTIAWLPTVWANVKGQMLLIMSTKDVDGDGVIRSAQQNTYDTAMQGANTFIGSQYITALRATAAMATLMGEPDLATMLEARATLARASYDKICYNAEFGYYIADVTAKDCANSYGPGCFTDQLQGTGLSTACGFGYIFPPAHQASAHAAILSHNKVTCPPAKDMQKHLFDGDTAIVCCTYPHGKLGAGMRYDTIVSTGFTSPNIASMVFEGNVAGAESIAGWIRERQDGRNRSPWNEPECNLLYSRAMAHWNIFDQCAGFAYDSTKSAVGFTPKVFSTAAGAGTADFKCFTTLHGGWGAFSQSGGAGLPSGTASLLCQYGTLSLKSLSLATSATAVTATVAGAAVSATIAAGVITFASEVTLQPSQTLVVTLSGGKAIAVDDAVASAAVTTSIGLRQRRSPDGAQAKERAAFGVADSSPRGSVVATRSACFGMSKAQLALFIVTLLLVLLVLSVLNFSVGAFVGALIGEERFSEFAKSFFGPSMWSKKGLL